VKSECDLSLHNKITQFLIILGNDKEMEMNNVTEQQILDNTSELCMVFNTLYVFLYVIYGIVS
jgi:hypothetical protein